MSAPAARTLTKEQDQAIATRGVSIALSAGAGCGKTFVLTERFLSFFNPRADDALQPEDIGQLIAITFTERAAREMRDRIRQRAYDPLLEADPHDLLAVKYWSDLVRCLDSARVSTIHSFCASLLRSHAVEAGLDPQFAVLEQSEAETILSELIDDTLRQTLSDRDPDTLELLVRFSLEQVRLMVRKLAGRRERTGYAQWRDCSPETLVETWSAYHREQVPRAVLRKVAASMQASRVLRWARQGVSSQALMRDRCATICDKLTAWRQNLPLSTSAAVAELNELHECAKIIGGKDWFSDEVKESFGKAASDLRAKIKDCKMLLEFDAGDARTVAEFSLRILRLSARVVEAYDAEKQRLARLDFDDLLIGAHRLLTDPTHEALQHRLTAQTRLLLVDEFQDTDPLQVELVRALCGKHLAGGKLFFVGDLKQSIYRFRGAQPRVFVDLQDAMPTAGRLPLSKNFRSQPAIVNFINALFREELTDDYRPLVAHRQQVSPQPSVEFLWTPAQPAAGQRKEAVDTLRKREAEWLARRLRAMLDDGEPIVWDAERSSDGKPAARPARYGDIAILFRALTSVADYEQALEVYGIPYYLVGGSAFYAQQEVFDLVNLLRAIASPADALSLAGALRSPFFSLADETLFWLAEHPGGLAAGLFEQTLPAALTEAERVKASVARETLKQLRSQKDRGSVTELINSALELTGYDAALVAEFLGERKLANLNKLIEQARGFDRSGLFTLDDFITQLSEFVARQPKEPFAAVHPEAGNIVRLMSIHASKGLEFPIVVVPDLERKEPGDRDAVDFTSDLGPMIKLSPRGMETKSDKAVGGYDLYAVVSSEEDEDEARRLLYVATTRAADYLLLSSSVQTLGEPASAWTELLARHFDLTTGTLLDELPAGWQPPQVRVTTTVPITSAKPNNDRSRVDFAKSIAKARTMAEDGKASVPRGVGSLAVDLSARRQFSFSRLTGLLKTDVPEEASAAAAEYVLPASILDPLGLGTLVHAVLAEIDFAAHASGKLVDVRRLVDRHTDRHIEEPHGEREEAIAMIERLLSSPAGKVLATSRAAHTELEFILGWPPGEFTEGGVYLRGFIDRLWQDASGDWHVLDFKTNLVTAENVSSTAAKYELQMLVYALAVEQIFARPPKSLTLHFLREGREHSFDWNLEARKRVINMVNDAITAARNTPTHA